MASKNESPAKTRLTWTPELTQKLFVSVLEALPSGTLNYDQIAETFGEGTTGKIIGKRIYDLKKKYNLSAPVTGGATVEKPKPSPKKRKLADKADVDNTA